MTTAPTIVTSPPSPQAAAETLLTRVRQFQRTFNNQAAQPGERILGLCNALGLMAYPKNQPVLDNLGAEEAQALRQEFLELVLGECGHGNFPRLFAEALGLELPPGVVVEEEASVEGAEEAPGVKRWTRQSVINWINIPIEPEIYGKIIGRKTHNTPLLLSTLSYVDSVVQLLGKYGPMTIYQLCAMIAIHPTADSPLTLYSRVQETVKLLKHKLLLTAYPITGWGMKNMNLWGLETPGRIFYSILNNQPTASHQELADKLIYTQHTFGTNQVLASMTATAAVATRFGVFEHIVSTVLKEKPGLNTSDRTGVEVPAVKLAKSLEWSRLPKNRQIAEMSFGCHIDLMRSGTALEIGQIERKSIIPDGMGRLIYDSDLHLPTLIQACNLTEEDADFPGSSVSGRHYWPFILEYDRATEGAEFFAEKVEAYSRFYNTIQTAWPLEWGGKFPVILVVVEGSPVRMLSLMTAIRTALFKIKESNPAHKRLDNWWFTSADWFDQTFQQYLDPDTTAIWLRQASAMRSTTIKAATLDKAPKLQYGPDPHIWLPLDIKAERYDLQAVDNYVRGAISQFPKFMKTLRALPIPAIFNSLLLSDSAK